MSLRRAHYWDTRAFHNFLITRRQMPFVWGQNDCALFAADGILAITGVDIALEFRDRYSDETGALQAIRDICGGATVTDAAAYCAQKHGLIELAKPLFAKRGDLVIVRNNSTGFGSEIAGLVHLNGKHVVSVSERGLLRLPISNIVRSWSYE